VKRRELLAGFCGAAAWPLAGHAQQLPVIGFLSSRSSDESAPLVAAFREGLKEGGFVEGQTALIEYRWAENEYDRLPALAADLVRRQVSVIVAAGGPISAFTAKAATPAIPVVFTSVGNPVEIGLVAGLGRPGGNVTGIDATMTAELDAKRLELLHELLPALAVIGILVNPNRPDAVTQVKDIEAAARTLGLQVIIMSAGTEGDVDAAFMALVQQRLGALLISADPFFVSRRGQLVALAARHAIPTIYQWRDFVAVGGLISYGASLASAYRQAGIYTGRILKGTKPADLPIERPTKFELAVNLNTAKALGLTVPQSILLRADELIE
jgi:putative tryptophan/tyrosine transport system substrate-binding protein